MNDGPTHAHGHGMTGGWERWLAVPTLRAVLGAVTFAAVAAVVGVIVLWPTGEGRDAAISNAADLGLVTEHLSHVLRVSMVLLLQKEDSVHQEIAAALDQLAPADAR